MPTAWKNAPSVGEEGFKSGTGSGADSFEEAWASNTGEDASEAEEAWAGLSTDVCATGYGAVAASNSES